MLAFLFLLPGVGGMIFILSFLLGTKFSDMVWPKSSFGTAGLSFFGICFVQSLMPVLAFGRVAPKPEPAGGGGKKKKKGKDDWSEDWS